MKKQICAILAAAMMFSTFAGCQKGQDNFPANEIISNSAGDTAESSGTLLADFPVPERFTGDWTGVEGCVSVHADAAISLPEVDTIPTATVKRHFFTQEDADKLRGVFTGDSPFYEDNYVTKQSLEERLEVYYDMERGVIPIQLDGGNTKEVLEGYIERTKQQSRKPRMNPIVSPRSSSFKKNPITQSVMNCQVGQRRMEEKSITVFIICGTLALEPVQQYIWTVTATTISAVPMNWKKFQICLPL